MKNQETFANGIFLRLLLINMKLYLSVLENNIQCT